MTNEQIRKDFEFYMIGLSYTSGQFKRDRDGQYKDRPIQLIWNGWRSASGFYKMM